MQKRIFALIMIMLMVFMSAACGHKEKTEEGQKKEQKETTVETLDEEYGDTSLGISAKADKELEDYDTYLIMGTDLGKRSDIMLIVSVNRETGDSVMTTVDRDTYMQVKGGEIITVDGQDYEFYKCNRGYQKGGLRGAVKELNSHLDLNIRKAAAISWEGVADFIDRIGGLDVNVEEEMLSWINNNKDLNGYVQNGEQKIDHAGQQTLTGWQAVQYLRARKYAGGNARVRAERNESVFKQILEKTADLPEDEVADIYLEGADSLDTNMSYDALYALLTALRKSEPKGTPVWPYTCDTKWDKNYHFYYQVPTTLESNVAELHKVMFGQEDYKVSDECRALSDKIEELSETILVFGE